MSTALIRAALEHLSVEDRNFLRGVISKGDPLREALGDEQEVFFAQYALDLDFLSYAARLQC
jgi:hypothetical protein